MDQLKISKAIEGSGKKIKKYDWRIIPLKKITWSLGLHYQLKFLSVYTLMRVVYLMYAVWLLSALATKLAFITFFVW